MSKNMEKLMAGWAMPDNEINHRRREILHILEDMMAEINRTLYYTVAEIPLDKPDKPIKNPWGRAHCLALRYCLSVIESRIARFKPPEPVKDEAPTLLNRTTIKKEAPEVPF